MDVFVFDPVVHTLVFSMSTVPRWIAVAAGILGLTGVALGALGAHGPVHDTLVGRGTLDQWRTAAFYQIVHAVALLALAGWPGGGAKTPWIAGCWTVGIILFSGSIYSLALGGPDFLGPATPVGGLALLLGWFLVAWTAFSSPKA